MLALRVTVSLQLEFSSAGRRGLRASRSTRRDDQRVAVHLEEPGFSRVFDEDGVEGLEGVRADVGAHQRYRPEPVSDLMSPEELEEMHADMQRVRREVLRESRTFRRALYHRGEGDRDWGAWSERLVRP
jgi:hypothetical protein